MRQIEDRGQYVCSEVKHFIPANYGRTGDAFLIDGVTQRAASRLSLRPTFSSAPTAGGGSGGGGGGGSGSGGKPGSGDGKIIRIINANDRSRRERVLLNLRTNQGRRLC